MGNSKDKDQELLAIFLEEATDLIASLYAIAREWEKNLKDFHKITDLKRELHTLKGSARMVGQTSLGTLAHEMETLAEALAKSEIKIDRNIFELINLGLDQLSMMIDALKKQEIPPTNDAILKQFQKYLPSEMALQAKTASPVTPPRVTQEEIGKVRDEETQVKTSAAMHAGEEMVRIRSSLLETLNGLSTENNTLRVGFEQQVFSFGTYLRELRSDAKRLEGQLNNLKSEIQSYVNQAEITGRLEDKSLENNLELKRYINLEQMSSVLRETTIDLINTLKSLNESHTNMETLSLNQSRITTELQHRLSDTRLVPFESIVPRLSRITRQVSAELKKQVNFRVIKTEGEMDRNVLEHLIPSLEHILRNALDHGIESLAERKKREKPEIGTIEVNFTRSGSIAAIEVKDDGAGIDPNIIRKKAIKLGLLPKGSKISDEEVIRYILEPGFSTREAITQVSGRGVGMDVVANAVKELGGTLNIESEVGVGTRMIIRFPFTSSLNRILLFTAGNETLGILLSDISGVTNISSEEFHKIIKNDLPVFNSGDKSYHLHYLEALLMVDKKEIFIPNQKSFPVILLPSENFPLALVVENVLYSRELLVQALGAQFKLAEVCSGATFLGDGRVVYILDPEILKKKARWSEEQEHLGIDYAKRSSKRSKEKRLIMVVDDSASARAVTKRLLEKNQYEVVTAKDGLDALQQLESYHPDLMLVDIDMPRMDGFELANTMRGNTRQKDIPIVVITALANAERRQLAKDMQLEGFLAKPYENAQLLLTIQALIGNAN